MKSFRKIINNFAKMLEVHSHVALKRHCIVRSQLREKMMKTALIFCSKIHDRIQHCFLSCLLWFSCSCSRKRLRFRMSVCEKRQPRERGLGLVWLILPHNKFHCTCYHFTRAGNAMKFEPLRCRREKKIARITLALLKSLSATLQRGNRSVPKKIDQPIS